ncbi:MAG: amidohydrolase family protein [Pirellulales bacterium]|nr:amidohydrolase family protein [Pirellulales bacterium]
MNSCSLRARWLLPIDAPPIASGYVTIAEGRIQALGKWNSAVGPAEDLGDVLLLPGLVNAHTHLEFSALPRPLGARGMSLPAWIRLVIADRNRGDRDAPAAIAAGLKESLAAGVTTIGEISASPTAWYAAAQPPRLLLFQEAIGFSAARVDSVMADLQQRLAAAPAASGLSPHAPYTVHPELLVRLTGLAALRRTAVAMHLAESREELQLLASGDGPFRDLLIERSMWDEHAIPPRSTPLDYLRLLAEAPRALVIHGNYLDHPEIAFLAEQRQRMSVVYCPRTHGYFQHDPYPLDAMLRAGARIALGTDSRASNPDLSVLAELRYAARLHPSAAPAALVRMATLDGAESLGLQRDAGSLSIGKRADLLTIPCAAAADPYEQVLSSSAPPAGVWLAGRRLTAMAN